MELASRSPAVFSGRRRVCFCLFDVLKDIAFFNYTVSVDTDRIVIVKKQTDDSKVVAAAMLATTFT
jgi:hypothetical protein